MQTRSSQRTEKKSALSERDKHLAYEARKNQWCREHPCASPTEYQLAMRKIAFRLGV